MKKRRWLLGISVVGLAFLVASSLWVYFRSNHGPIRYENFEKIQEGMTRDEVEELLGCAPGDYTTGPVDFSNGRQRGFVLGVDMSFGTILVYEIDLRRLPVRAVWEGDRGTITVTFDSDGKVQDQAYTKGRPLPPRWWLWFERALGSQQ